MLVPFICEKCGKLLAWTLPDAAVYCKHCGKWIKNSEVKLEKKAITA